MVFGNFLYTAHDLSHIYGIWTISYILHMKDSLKSLAARQDRSTVGMVVISAL